MKYLVKLSYDGSNFYGFQRLNELRCVQGELERVLSIINKSPVEVKGAGRTDKGVHAYGQRAHFELDVDIPLDGLKKAMNDLLDKDVYIDDIMEVDDDFHARFSVKKKIYQYKINVGKYDPLKANYYLQVDYGLNLSKMREVAKVFLGIHDFRNFVAGERDNYEAVIYDINFDLKDDILVITFEGKSFYRYMVRNLVGAMLDVSRGKASVLDVVDMLDYPMEEKRLACAGAEGLYLMDIIY